MKAFFFKSWVEFGVVGGGQLTSRKMTIKVFEGRLDNKKKTASLCSTATAKVSLSKAPTVEPRL